MGSCSSTARRVSQISELDLRASVQDSRAPQRKTTSTFKQSIALSDSSNGFSSKRIYFNLTASFAKPEDSDSVSAELLEKLTGINIRNHVVVMVTLSMNSKQTDKASIVRTFAAPKIDWGNLSVERQVPKRIPTEITVHRFQVFAIIEPGSSLTSTVQIRGKMNGEKVLIMCSIDGKEKSDVTVHDELFSYLQIKKVGDNVCWSCKGSLLDSGEGNPSSGTGENIFYRHDDRKEFDSLNICRKVSIGESEEDCSLNRSPVPNIQVSPVSFRDLAPLGRMSMSSLSTIAQVGSLSSSPVRKASGSSSEESDFHRRFDQQQQPDLQQPQAYVQSTVKKHRRPTPITTRVPRKIKGKKNVMQIFFEDEEETNHTFGGVGHSPQDEIISATTVDRKLLPSIEGDSRPPSAAEPHCDARYSRKFMWTPVLENNEVDGDRESIDEDSTTKINRHLPPIKPGSTQCRTRKLSQLDRPVAID